MAIDTRRLAARVRAKRGKVGLRAAAEEIKTVSGSKVSASTLSRVEQGHVPDLETFISLCKWLGASQQEFVESGEEPDTTTVPEKIEFHLRADRTLDPETVDALITMIRLAYDAAERGKLPRE